MDNQPQYTLREFPKDELDKFNKELQALCDKHSAHLVSKPRFTEQGTVSSAIMAFKKILLVPKEDGTLVPTEEKENGSDSSASPEKDSSASNE